MIDPAILRALEAAGCTTNQIIAAVEAAAEADEARRERKREGNRQRQARHKAKKRAEAVTRANGSNALPSVTPPPNEVYSNPPPDPPIVISDEITPPAENPVLKPEHVLEAWNAMADRTGVPKAKLTPERRKKLSPFIRRHSVDDITEAIGAVERSPFLRGENDRGWRADFDFLLQPKSFTRLTEGAYDR